MESNDKIALEAVTGKVETIKDGVVKMAVYFNAHLFPDVAEQFGVEATHIGVIRLQKVEVKIGGITQLENKKKGPYGKYAQLLDRYKFWENSEVIRLAGKDTDYQEWCRKHEYCAITGRRASWDTDKGVYRAEYAHSNFADNSGTGIKATYSGLPVYWEVHRNVEHQRGRSALEELAMKFMTLNEKQNYDGDFDNWIKNKSKEYAGKWAREAIKEKYFQMESWQTKSWTEVDPVQFIVWSFHNNVNDLVPQDYKDAVKMM